MDNLEFAELVVLLERFVDERTSRRQAYRDAAASELGRLTTEVVRADGNNAPDSTLERLNGQLAAIEDDLAWREHKLSDANAKLKNFRLANGIDSGPTSYHGRLFDLWTYARDAALAVDFEPHLTELEKSVAAHPIQKAVATASRRQPGPNDPRALTAFAAASNADARD